MERFFSCDWGTSSFRLRLINAADADILAEEKAGFGIAEAYSQWQAQPDAAKSRTDFYADVIKEKIAVLSQQSGLATDGIPVILSGMASSTIGMSELPYKELPFRLDGSDLITVPLGDVSGGRSFLMISGARTDHDVMRGEETKIVGCRGFLSSLEKEPLLVLPGTHPKHITVRNGSVPSFKTYMTGEFFGLLSSVSILSASVKNGGNFNEPASKESFIEGVKAGRNADLLHEAFMVRTNQVIKKLDPQQNYYYLSGLLIGSELGQVGAGTLVALVGGAAHCQFYKLACGVLDLHVGMEIDADVALIEGQRVIFNQFFS